MERGTTVRVVFIPEKYRRQFSQLFGQIGTVERESYGFGDGNGRTVGVRFEQLQNPSSGHGLYWFPVSCLSVVEEEEGERSEGEMMLPGYTVHEVQFLDGNNTNKVYRYACYDDSIRPNDYVVIQTGHHGYAVAQTLGRVMVDPSTVTCGREIICRVDMEAFNQRKEKATRMATLEREMEKAAAKVQKLTLYETLAASDPAFQAMLSEYKGLIE